MGDHLRQPPRRIGDHRRTTGHRLQRRQAERLGLARHQEKVGAGQELVDRGVLAQEEHIVLDPEPAGGVGGLGALGTVSDQHQPGRHVRADAGKDADHFGHSLHGPEVGDVHDDLLAARGQHLAVAGDASPPEERGVHEVGDDLNALGGHLKVPDRGVPEEAGDGGHALGAHDREAGDRPEGRVKAHQRHVGSVEGGEERRRPVAVQHLLRDPGRGGVGNGVVDVHHVQLLAEGGVVDRRRKGQGVGRMLEEGIAVDLHLVQVDALVEARKAKGLGVGHEVDLVAALGQADPQGRRDGPGAAVGGVAGDPDLHGALADAPAKPKPQAEAPATTFLAGRPPTAVLQASITARA